MCLPQVPRRRLLLLLLLGLHLRLRLEGQRPEHARRLLRRLLRRQLLLQLLLQALGRRLLRLLHRHRRAIAPQTLQWRLDALLLRKLMPIQ